MKGAKIVVTKDVRGELERLHKKHRKLTEELIVDASKPKDSPLHGMFLWDNDDQAARIGRCEIARALLYQVKLTLSDMKELNMTVRMRQYVGDCGGGYMDLRSIVKSKDKYQMLLDAAIADLKALKEKYACLKELGEVFDLIGRLDK